MSLRSAILNGALELALNVAVGRALVIVLWPLNLWIDITNVAIARAVVLGHSRLIKKRRIAILKNAGDRKLVRFKTSDFVERNFRQRKINTGRVVNCIGVQ